MNQSHQKLNIEPTRELIRVLIALEENPDFLQLMKLVEDRAQGLAAWSCLIDDELRMRWAQGRVQEMSDLVRTFAGRRRWREVLDKKTPPSIEY